MLTINNVEKLITPVKRFVSQHGGEFSLKFEQTSSTSYYKFVFSFEYMILADIILYRIAEDAKITFVKKNHQITVRIPDGTLDTPDIFLSWVLDVYKQYNTTK